MPRTNKQRLCVGDPIEIVPPNPRGLSVMKAFQTNTAPPTDEMDPKAKAMWEALGEEGAAALGALLGEIDAELVKRGFEPPGDAVELIKLANEVGDTEKHQRSLAGHRIPKGARSPLRRRTVDVLSEREHKMLAAQKVDPAKYTKARAAMKARSPRGAK